MNRQNALTFEVEKPPSANNLYRNVPGKGRVRSDAYKAWQHRAGWQVELARPGFISGKVEVRYAIPWPKDKRRRDLENLAKPLSDLLVKHRLIEDDSRIVRLELAYADVPQVVVDVRGAEVPA